jgi:hypothetical protein
LHHTAESIIASTLQDHADGTFMPTNEYCNLFEKDSRAAQARFAVGSGFNAHGDAFMNPIIDPETGLGALSESDRRKLINVGPLSQATVLNAVDQFIKYTDPAQPIHVCGCCGMKGFSHNQQGKKFDSVVLVKDDGAWSETTYGNKKSASYRTLLDMFEIEACNQFKYTQGRYRKVRNFARINDKYLHLYNDYLVRTDSTDRISIMLCGYCIVDVRKGVVPSHSVKFRDFGHLNNFRKIVLGGEGRSLSLAERTVCSYLILFSRRQ